ncbi:hypothetical protein, partial [Bacteroides sp.]
YYLQVQSLLLPSIVSIFKNAAFHIIFTLFTAFTFLVKRLIHQGLGVKDRPTHILEEKDAASFPKRCSRFFEKMTIFQKNLLHLSAPFRASPRNTLYQSVS